MRVKKLILKCSYCESTFSTTQDNLNYNCPHCGGSNDSASIIDTIEEEIPAPKPPRKKKNPIILICVIVGILFFGLPLLSFIIRGVVTISTNSEKTYDTTYQITNDAWKTDAKTSFILTPMEKLLSAFEAEDYDAILELVYLPEGSIYDKESFTKLLKQDSDYSILLGQHYEISYISSAYSGDSSVTNFSVSLKRESENEEIENYSIHCRFMSDGGAWKLRLDNCFHYGLQYMLPAQGTIYFDDIELPESIISIRNPQGSNSMIYRIPAMTKTLHTVTYETVFGTINTTIENDDKTYSDRDPNPVLEIENGSKLSNDIYMQINKFCKKMVRVSYGLEDISILDEFLSSDYGQDVLEEQISCFQQKIKEDNGEFENDGDGHLYRAFPVSTDEICVIFNFHAGDTINRQFFMHHSSEGALKVTMENGKIVLKSFKDNGMFECDSRSRYHELPW